MLKFAWWCASRSLWAPWINSVSKGIRAKDAHAAKQIPKRNVNSKARTIIILNATGLTLVDVTDMGRSAALTKWVSLNGPEFGHFDEVDGK